MKQIKIAMKYIGKTGKGGGGRIGASNSHFKFLGAETDGVTIDFNNIADALVNFA